METGFRLCILEIVIGCKTIKIKKLLTVLYKGQPYSQTYRFPFQFFSEHVGFVLMILRLDGELYSTNCFVNHLSDGSVTYIFQKIYVSSQVFNVV